MVTRKINYFIAMSAISLYLSGIYNDKELFGILYHLQHDLLFRMLLEDFLILKNIYMNKAHELLEPELLNALNDAPRQKLTIPISETIHSYSGFRYELEDEFPVEIPENKTNYIIVDDTLKPEKTHFSSGLRKKFSVPAGIPETKTKYITISTAYPDTSHFSPDLKEKLERYDKLSVVIDMLDNRTKAAVSTVGEVYKFNMDQAIRDFDPDRIKINLDGVEVKFDFSREELHTYKQPFFSVANSLPYNIPYQKSWMELYVENQLRIKEENKWNNLIVGLMFIPLLMLFLRGICY